MTWAEQDLNNYLRDLEEDYSRLPVCDCCGDTITGDYEYNLDGERYCEDCAEEWLQKHRKEVEYETD